MVAVFGMMVLLVIFHVILVRSLQRLEVEYSLLSPHDLNNATKYKKKQNQLILNI